MSVLHVVFKVAGAEYAIPAADVLHMETFTGATPVPGAPPYVAGLVQVRGRVVPVVDVRARFALPPRQASQDPDAVPEARVVVVQAGTRVVGLLVDSAREVVRIPPEALRPPPDLLSGSETAFVRSIAQSGQRLFMLIDFNKVIGEEQSHAQ
jgi:purine-binding chemotaxis protein CheW